MTANLREALAAALWKAEEGARVDWSETNDWWRQKYRRSADAVLALPEMAALLADAERVKRRVWNLLAAAEERAHTARNHHMETTGALTIESIYRYPVVRHRITHADPHIRILAGFITRAAAGHLAPRLHLTDGDHLTFADDYGQHVTYRINWDNYSSGFLAELVIEEATATTTEMTA